MNDKTSRLSTLIILTMMVLIVISGITSYYSMKKEYAKYIANYETDCRKTLNHCLQLAIDTELTHRTSIPESNFIYEFKAYPPDDTTHYTTKTIETMDTVFRVRIRKDDSRAIAEIRQYILKVTNPIDLRKLDQYLRQCLEANKIHLKEFYFEYINKRKKKEIKHYPDTGKPVEYIASDTLGIDILNSVGVCAYINKDNPGFWETKKEKIIKDFAFHVAIFILSLFLFIFRKQIFNKVE